jgi:uncharacterized lipoprotein YajG
MIKYLLLIIKKVQTMKNILILISFTIFTSLLFQACSSKEQIEQTPKVAKIDMNKVNKAYKELDEELNKQQ